MTDKRFNRGKNIPTVPVEKYNGAIMSLYCFNMPCPVFLFVIPGLFMTTDRVFPVIINIKTTTEPEKCFTILQHPVKVH